MQGPPRPDLADIAGRLASLKGETRSWLRDPNYDTLRLEVAHSAAAVADIFIWLRARPDQPRGDPGNTP